MKPSELLDAGSPSIVPRIIGAVKLTGIAERQLILPGLHKPKKAAQVHHSVD